MAEIILAEIIHLQPHTSNEGCREIKVLNLIPKTFMRVCINPLYFLVAFSPTPSSFSFFSLPPARSLMKLKCQVSAALYPVLSIKGR